MLVLFVVMLLSEKRPGIHWEEDEGESEGKSAHVEIITITIVEG